MPLPPACSTTRCASRGWYRPAHWPKVALPEREPHEPVFHALAALIDAFESPVWAAAYVRWELGLLQELGFGLDLGACAATGTNNGLAYVSPRTGRAVSLSAGEPYRDKLLLLPGFLVGQGGGGEAEVLAGLELTGHFLDRNVFATRDTAMPAARTRFLERYRKTATHSGSR
jgi:DNA repair protein RecO (recombination protein O)